MNKEIISELKDCYSRLNELYKKEPKLMSLFSSAEKEKLSEAKAFLQNAMQQAKLVETVSDKSAVTAKIEVIDPRFNDLPQDIKKQAESHLFGTGASQIALDLFTTEICNAYFDHIEPVIKFNIKDPSDPKYLGFATNKKIVRDVFIETLAKDGNRFKTDKFLINWENEYQRRIAVFKNNPTNLTPQLARLAQVQIDNSGQTDLDIIENYKKELQFASEEVIGKMEENSKFKKELKKEGEAFFIENISIYGIYFSSDKFEILWGKKRVEREAALGVGEQKSKKDGKKIDTGKSNSTGWEFNPGKEKVNPVFLEEFQLFEGNKLTMIDEGEGMKKLRELAAYLRESEPDLSITIVGSSSSYTNNESSKIEFLKLAEDRAKRVRRELVSLGIERKRIFIEVNPLPDKILIEKEAIEMQNIKIKKR